VHIVAAIAIACIGILNYRGVRWGTLIQNSTTIIKCGGLLALIILAFTLGAPSSSLGANISPVEAPPPGAIGIIPFGLALIAVEAEHHCSRAAGRERTIFVLAGIFGPRQVHSRSSRDLLEPVALGEAEMFDKTQRRPA
jgi:amino acid transporter